ncbi:MAG: methylmalonyl-CoA mutase family protein [Rhizobiaceae bacterium]
MDAAQLFREIGFEPSNEADWRRAAESSLQGRTVEETLVSTTDDGIAIHPIRPAGAVRSALGRVRPDLPWIFTQRVDDMDPRRANKQAREDVDNGATGLAVVFAGAPNAFGFGLPPTPEALAVALDGIPLDRVYLRVDAHPASRASADWLLALLMARRGDPGKLRLSFGLDPAASFASSGRMRMSVEALQASMPPSLAHFFAMDVPGVLLEGDGRVYHNAGATEAQELAIALATVVSHLRMFEAARQPLVYATSHIGFAVAVDQDQFLSMAKIRALRKLWARAQEACSIPPSPGMIHAETSWRMTTKRDPETNILRYAVAIFAAASGGADSIAVLPHTIAHGLPDPFARRVARNAHIVMAREAHIDFVADPAAGSGSIEDLTEALCEAAWAEFQTIDSEGGILNSLTEGRVQARIAEARERRRGAHLRNERSIVGTTLHPAPSERRVETLGAPRPPVVEDGPVQCEALAAARLDEDLETPA